MNTPRRWIGMFVAGFVGILTLAPAGAEAQEPLRMAVQNFACETHGFVDAYAAIQERLAALRLFFKADGLAPLAEISCGFSCVDPPIVDLGPCGRAGATGKWSFTRTVPTTPQCRGFLPIIALGEEPDLCTPATSRTD